MIIMYDDRDIDEKSQVLRKISEAEKCFAQLSYMKTTTYPNSSFRF